LCLWETDDNKTQLRENKKRTQVRNQKTEEDNNTRGKAITCGTVRAKRGKQATWFKKVQSQWTDAHSHWTKLGHCKKTDRAIG